MARQQIRAVMVQMIILMMIMIAAGRAQADSIIPARLVAEHWTVADDHARRVIDHSQWQQILDGYVMLAPPIDRAVHEQVPRRLDHHLDRENDDRTEVTGDHYGRRTGLSHVDYRALAFTPADQAVLKSYLAAMQKIVITDYNKSEQLAYWVNLFNAGVMDYVVTHQDQPLDRGADAEWLDEKSLSVEGRPLSLRDIRDGILRPVWHDPRVLYLLHLPASGSPDLLPEAVTGRNTDEVLESAALRFINHPRGVSIRGIVHDEASFFAGGRMVVSSLYQWFQPDFGDINNDRAVIRHLEHYADHDLRDQLSGVSAVSDYAYDTDPDDRPEQDY